MSIKNRRPHSSSLFSMLIAHYAVFTLIVLLVLITLVQLSDLLISGVLHSPAGDHTSALLARVEAGQYSAVPAERWLGRGAGFQVVQADGRVLYSSANADAAARFTPQELACIPDGADGGTGVSVTEQNSADGRRLTVYQFYGSTYYTAGNDDNAGQTLLVLDETRQVVLSTAACADVGMQLNENEMQLLQGIWNGRTISSLHCTLPGGAQGFVLLYYPSLTDRQISTVTMLNNLLLPLFGVLYVILMVLFVLWLQRRVKKPLRILSVGMQALADGDRGAQLEYRGPAEFVQMCASFNRMSARMYEAEQQQKKAEAEKQKMLADISHDLKTPITVIQGYAKAICDGLIPEAEKERYLRAIYQKSTDLDRLIEAFHTYSKLEHPEFHLQTVRRDLCEMLREQLAARYDEAELAGFSMEVEIPEKPLYAQLDALQFQRAVDNILANALRHNPAGTKLLVRLMPPAAGGVRAAQILLADSGVGIPPALAAHVFEPFAVGDDARGSAQGSGLGLAISKKIIEAHGGTIVLAPAEGEWVTRFVLTVPVE